MRNLDFGLLVKNEQFLFINCIGSHSWALISYQTEVQIGHKAEGR